MQNSKASNMFDSQPLDSVVCSNYIDNNLILLIFKDILTNFDPMSALWWPPHVAVMDAPT